MAIVVLFCSWSTSFADNNSVAAFSKWPDTGQKSCYDSVQNLNPCPTVGKPFFGQDANYSGPAHSYTSLINGIMVKDNVTGLVWELKNGHDDIPNMDNPHDADNEYAWCNPYGAISGEYQGVCNQPNTKTFIDSINQEHFGGYSDWRVPTIQELASLADRGINTPASAIDPIFNLISDQFGWYWSATYLASDPQKSWEIWLGGAGGLIIPTPHNNGTVQKSCVRAVRGGLTIPQQERYIDNEDGTVTDNATCLQWQKGTLDSDGDGEVDWLTWQQALQTAEDLAFAGYSDWRLPNINELLSLVDYSRHSPAIDPIFAATTRMSYHHSSTPHIYSDLTWKLEFQEGRVVHYDKTDISTLRVVRNGHCIAAQVPGDIDYNGKIELKDAILSLQVLTGHFPFVKNPTKSDVNGDQKIGTEEAIYSLQKVARLR